MSTAARPTSRHLAYLSIGSNIDPERNLRAAIARLRDLGDLQAISSVWETKPVGYTNQPDFLNAAAVLATPLSAPDLKSHGLTPIERALGRDRSRFKHGPRTIDLDLVLFNRDILEFDTHRIPDPELLQAPFIAIPLAEIAPAYLHPVTGQTLEEIAGKWDPEASGMRRRPEISLPEIVQP